MPTDAVRGLLANIHITPALHWDSKDITLDVLQNKPVVIVGNHPAHTEPLYMMAAVPPRQDISAIADSEAKKILGHEFDAFLMPVKPLQKTRGRQRNLLREKNNTTVIEAAKKVEKGGAMFLMPAGGSREQKWRVGIIKLLRAIQRDDAYVVMMHVPKSSLFDLLQAIPFFRRGKELPRDVYIRQPIRLQALRTLLEADDAFAVEDLRKMYVDWVDKLPKSPH